VPEAATTLTRASDPRRLDVLADAPTATEIPDRVVEADGPDIDLDRPRGGGREVVAGSDPVDLGAFVAAAPPIDGLRLSAVALPRVYG
jgi:hypothetical protein